MSTLKQVRGNCEFRSLTQPFKEIRNDCLIEERGQPTCPAGDGEDVKTVAEIEIRLIVKGHDSELLRVNEKWTG